MQFSFDLTWLLTVALLSVRLAIVLFASPLDAFGRVPARVRVFFTIALAVFMASLAGVSKPALPGTGIELAVMVLNEVVLGIAMALAVHLAFAAFDLAGRLIDFQSGLGAASLINPATNAAEPLFGTVLMLLATLVFFLADGHHLFLQGLVFSLQMIPPGQPLPALDLPLVMHHLGLMFGLGLVLAAPVLACLLLVDIGIAVMARTMPQMNVYFLFLPLKVFLGLALTAMTLKYLSPLFLQVFTSLFRHWEATVSV